MMNKYYLIIESIIKAGDDDECWQLEEGIIIEDVGTNMFVYESAEDLKKDGGQQADRFTIKIVKAYVEEGRREFINI